MGLRFGLDSSQESVPRWAMSDFTTYVSDRIRPHPPRRARELQRQRQPTRADVVEVTGFTKQALRRRLERKTNWQLVEVPGLAHAIGGNLQAMLKVFKESPTARGPMGRPKKNEEPDEVDGREADVFKSGLSRW